MFLNLCVIEIFKKPNSECKSYKFAEKIVFKVLRYFYSILVSRIKKGWEELLNGVNMIHHVFLSPSSTNLLTMTYFLIQLLLINKNTFKKQDPHQSTCPFHTASNFLKFSLWKFLFFLSIFSLQKKKRSNLFRASRVTIVGDRKSVLHETESQLNAIAKPFCLRSKALSLLLPFFSLSKMKNIFIFMEFSSAKGSKWKEIKNSRYVQAITNCGGG